MSSTLIRPIQIEPTLDTDPAGTVRAIVATFGNVDKMGDRIVRGAFAKTLAARRAAGCALPVVYSHDWGSANSILGYADPFDLEEVAGGLYVKMQLNLDLPWAKAVYQLLQQGALQWSIGYVIPKGGQRKGADGANELLEIDLFECGPCRASGRSTTRPQP
jgi:uncharacterized protein